MAQPIVMPSMGMYTEEGVLSAWLKPAGAHVEIGEPIAEITTEKVTFEIPSSVAGNLHPIAELGATLRVEELLGYILAEGETSPWHDKSQTAFASKIEHSGSAAPALQEGFGADGPLRASPAARKLANRHGIDLSSVQGTGPGGRIVEADVLAKIPE